jgi:hypothetical protein
LYGRAPTEPAPLGSTGDGDADVLGLVARTELVKAGLELLHRQAAEERMARGVEEEFHHGQEPPPSPFVRRSRHRPAGDDTTVPGPVGDDLG